MYITSQDKNEDDEVLKSLYQNITKNDVELAGAYYPILIDLAKHKRFLTYGQLVQKAKQLHPEISAVQKAIAVSTGRKLEVVRVFTKARGLPDITSLIINKTAGECGDFYSTHHFDPVKLRNEVFAYDWDTALPEFYVFTKTLSTIAKVTKATKNEEGPRRRTEEEAANLLYAFYKENKTEYPLSIKDKKAILMTLLMEGSSPEEAFAKVLS